MSTVTLAFQGALIPTRSSMPFTAATALPAMSRELVAPRHLHLSLAPAACCLLDFYGVACGGGCNFRAPGLFVTQKRVESITKLAERMWNIRLDLEPMWLDRQMP